MWFSLHMQNSHLLLLPPYLIDKVNMLKVLYFVFFLLAFIAQCLTKHLSMSAAYKIRFLVSVDLC